MKTVTKRVTLLLWLAIAAAQLLLSAPIASPTQTLGLENHSWEIFPLAAQSHQAERAQLSEAQRERARVQRSTAPGDVPQIHFPDFDSYCADPGRSIVADLKGITLASGYTTRAQWLAALKAADLAANAKGLFTAQSLLANLSGSIPHGATFQNTLSRPDFLKMVQQHQAWIAKNDPGFYSWQHKVEQQVQKKIDAENSS
jgi:hypothetical protein